MMMEREGRALPGASPESRESAQRRSLQEGRRDSDICASPSSPTASREIPGLVPSGTRRVTVTMQGVAGFGQPGLTVLVLSCLV